MGMEQNIMAQEAVADIGLIGLAVMGENLALNIADHGFKVAVYNRTTETMKKFIARENPPGGLVGCETTNDLVAAIKRPRKFIILVKAGRARRRGGQGTDRFRNRDSDDIVVDCGNSLWTDTIRREKEYATPVQVLRFGRVGRRTGRALRPIDDAGRRSGLVEASQAHLGSRCRQGRCQDG